MVKYNLPHEEIKVYEVYEGKNVERMPELLADKRNPMSIAGLMQRRLSLRHDKTGVKDFYIDNYFYTGDLKAQKGDDIKLVLTTYADGSLTPFGREYLSLINPEEKLVKSAVNLGIEDRYEKLNGDGVIITDKSKLVKVINEWLTEQQAKDSLFWRVMLRHPDEVPKEFAISGLHKEAIEYIFAEAKQRFDYKTVMGIFLGDNDGKTPEMRAWCVGRLGYRSLALGRFDLGDDGGRLVGIASETPNAPGKGASSIKAYTMADLEAFDSTIRGLEATIRPELLEPIVQLRKKL